MYLRYFRLSIFLMVLALTPQASASSLPYIVADMDTGAILEENAADHRWYPASLTKMMTSYVTFRAISAQEISIGSPVLITHEATRQPPSRMGYKKGVKLRVDTALKIIIIKSANDVSMALAQAVAGSLEAFVGRMNAEAARLGMSNTRFANSNGLHDRGQFSSARDMAILAAAIMREYPQYAKWFSAVGIRTPVKTHMTYNLLLERFPGTTGMKTGFVCAAGYNLVATATLNNRNLVAVVLGRSSQTDRAVTAARLLSENRTRSGSGSIFEAASTGADPRNMRPILCTKEAREKRYDPAAGAAVIESEFLSPRKPSSHILEIATGGVDAPPSLAWITAKLTVKGTVPVPSPRPDYDPATGTIRLLAIGAHPTGQLPVPTPSPR